MTVSSPIRFAVRHGGRLRGCLRVPGDKSISHRSVMLGSVAEGVTRVEGFLEGEDSLATLEAFRRMGVRIEGPDAGRVVVHGVGLHGLRPPDGPLDLGNSGTSMRLLAGLLAPQPFGVTLVGDTSLTRRPMRRVTEPLAAMGARVETGAGGTPPLVIHPVPGLRGIDYAWFIRRDAAGRRTHHIHFLEAGSSEWERLLFRDYLRSHPEAARAYGELKQRIAAEHPDDRVAYAKAKTRFVRAAMHAARRG